MADILVVGSKVKKYIKEKAGFNTSGKTLEALSQQLETICDRAIETARENGRKTVLDRDVS